MVLLITHIELKCVLVAIREDNCQCENCRYNKDCKFFLQPMMRCRAIEKCTCQWCRATYILEVLLAIHVAELGSWGARGQACSVCKSRQPQQSSTERYGGQSLSSRHLSLLHLLSLSVDCASHNRRLSAGSRHCLHSRTCPDCRSCAQA
jgi:hypothetical protein